MTFNDRELRQLTGAPAGAATPAVIGFNGTGVTVKDLKRSLHFYVDIFGYTIIGPPKTGRSQLLDRLLELDNAE
jgi:hypothetical protein